MAVNKAHTTSISHPTTFGQESRQIHQLHLTLQDFFNLFYNIQNIKVGSLSFQKCKNGVGPTSILQTWEGVHLHIPLVSLIQKGLHPPCKVTNHYILSVLSAACLHSSTFKNIIFEHCAPFQIILLFYFQPILHTHSLQTH